MTNTGPPTFVDREPEIRGFCKLLQPERPRSVMLIGGGQWLGKSWLLSRMVAECRQRGQELVDQEAGAPAIANVDFRNPRDIGEELDTLGLVRLLRDKLDEPSYFSPLNVVINRFTERGLATGVRSLNHLAGRMSDRFDLAELARLSRDLDVRFEDLPGVNTRYEKAFQLADHILRAGRLPELIARLEELRDGVDWQQGLDSLLQAAGPTAGTGPADGMGPAQDLRAPLPADKGRGGATRQMNAAFFECLNGLAVDHRLVVLLFDSCEAAPDSAKAWIRHQLLDRLGAGELENVVVIIAGRTLPDISDLDVGHLVAHTVLDPFDEVRVSEFFEAHGLRVEPQEVSSATRWSGGVPGDLARIVDRMRAEADRRDSLFD